eukprot:gene13399-13527_t
MDADMCDVDADLAELLGDEDQDITTRIAAQNTLGTVGSAPASDLPHDPAAVGGHSMDNTTAKDNLKSMKDVDQSQIVCAQDNLSNQVSKAPAGMTKPTLTGKKRQLTLPSAAGSKRTSSTVQAITSWTTDVGNSHENKQEAVDEAEVNSPPSKKPATTGTTVHLQRKRSHVTPQEPQPTPAADTETADDPAKFVKLPKAKNAFMFFSEEKRTSIKREYSLVATWPSTASADSYVIGELWKALDDTGKLPYVNNAAQDAERVRKEIEGMDPAVVAAARLAAVEKRSAAAAKKAASKQDRVPASKKNESHQQARKKQESLADQGATDAEAGGSKACKAAVKAAAKGDKANKAERAAAKEAAKADRAAALEAGRKKKAGIQVFCQGQFKAMKQAHPDKDSGELMHLLTKAFSELPAEEQQDYVKQAEELAECAKAAKSKTVEDGEGGGSTKSRGASRKRSKASAASTGANGSSDGDSSDGQDTDDSDREDVDWESNPAEAVLAATGDKRGLLIIRKGLDLTEYGRADAAKVRHHQQLMASSSAAPSRAPVGAALLAEYETSCKRFWTAVRQHTVKGSLDLGDLEQGSPLELCYLLGKLREPGMLLDANDRAAAKAAKARGEEDIVIRVPALKLSMIVQRLVDLERAKTAAAHSNFNKLASMAKDGPVTQEQLRKAFPGMQNL